MTIVHRLRERVTSVRVRAVLSLGIVLGLGSVSTLAYWTDTGTMTTGSIQAGTLDLQPGRQPAGSGGNLEQRGARHVDHGPRRERRRDRPGPASGRHDRVQVHDDGHRFR